jgi:hypothetical protein
MLPEFGCRETMFAKMRHEELLAEAEHARLVAQCKANRNPSDSSRRTALGVTRLFSAVGRQISSLVAATATAATAKR